MEELRSNESETATENPPGLGRAALATASLANGKVEDGASEIAVEAPQVRSAEELMADVLERGGDKEIALKLIEQRHGGWVFNKLSKFEGLVLDQEIALKLIDNGFDYLVTNNLEKFNGLVFDQELALRFAEHGSCKFVINNIEKFEGLDQEVALMIIKKGYSNLVIDNLEKFEGLVLNRELALKMIEAWGGGEDNSIVVDYPEKFEGLVLNREIALKLIESRKGDLLAKNLRKFEGLDREIALRLIDGGYANSVIDNLEKFEKLDREVALKLIKGGRGNSVIDNLEKFEGLVFDQEFALKLIEEEASLWITDNLEKFTGLGQEVALKLIDGRHANFVINNLEKFEGLDREVALKLIEKRYGNSVVENLEKFEGLDREVALKLIEKGYDNLEVNNLDKFEGLVLDQEFALKLIEQNCGYFVVKNLEKFEGLDREIALRLIEKRYDNSVINNLERFEGLVLDREFALEIISTGGEGYVRDHSEKFEGLTLTSDSAKGAVLPNLVERLIVDEHNTELTREDGELDYEKVFDLLKEKVNSWRDEGNVAGPFKRGAEVFGDKKMFEYANRDDVSRHDQLFFFDSVIKMFDGYKDLMKKGDEPADEKKLANMFFANILQQVKMDTSNEEDSSYVKLATIAQNIDFSPEGLAKYKGQMDSLKSQGFEEEMARLESLMNSDCFDSWKNLKALTELLDQLARGEIWSKLAVLKQEAATSERAAAMYDYVATIMFHKDSSVNVGAAEEFFLDPEGFLEENDVHAPEDVHSRKKPSNYLDIPNLDLKAKELVEALAIGEIDKIQTFTGMEVEYVVSELQGGEIASDASVIEGADESLFGRVKAEIGSRKLGNANPKLFGKVSKLLKANNMKLNLQDTASLEASLTPELTEQIEGLLKEFPNQINVDRGEIRTANPGKKYRVKVYDKHDPKAALAGDDTNCCMPFGSGKNNVYTFNPNCGLVTVEMEKVGGGYITIAQSVLTLDQNIGASVSGLVDKLSSEDNDALASIDVSGGENYIACDNIEIRQNYQTEKNREVIAGLYQDFFARYTKVFNQSNLTGRVVNTDKVVVGQGYSDYRFGRQEKNTYVPLAPVSYSDKLGDTVNVITLENGAQKEFGLKVVAVNMTTPEQFKYNEDLRRGVSPLTYQDALLVTQLESKAYDGSSLTEGMSAMENSLIAKDINNAIKDRPNMSFKYGNAGYILAYEGKIDALEGERGLYVEDLAADSENQLAGGTLMLTFLEEYKKNYVDKGDGLPIFAQMRESTSYALVKNNIERFEKRLGLKLEMEELGSYEAGDDVIHRVVLRVT